jgi:16S rRNA C1402 (ribose-2'-O) methylase RsmI
MVCSRELTKKFEEVQRERSSQLIEHFTKNRPRGEFVLIFNPNL